nr:cell death regulator Aven isoform X1 [Pogona vitticeps]
MQPERGDRPRRGGGRQTRRRPGGRERQAEGAGGRAEDGPNRGGRSRGRSGGGGRGGGQGRRDTRGRGVAASPSAPQCYESAAVDLELQEEGREDQGSYSRRKVVSNWHRYEDSEKEIQNDSVESQRGTDFSVLLSSAGDSFTQFRFSEEKEWSVENLCPKQFSGLYVDCQSLVQALDNLPLHLRLNVDAELVQNTVPVTLPQSKLKSNDVPMRSGGIVQPSMGQSKVAPSSYPAAGSAAPFILPKKDGCDTSSEAHQKSPSVERQETDHLDEDLDLLLKLDAPANPENNFALSLDTLSDDWRTPHEEKDHLQLDGMQDLCSTTQEVTSKNITEEELEDWLDSMIS